MSAHLHRYLLRMMNTRRVQSIIFVLGLTSTILLYKRSQFREITVLADSWINLENILQNSAFRISSDLLEGTEKSGCDIPEVSAWSPQVAQFFASVDQVECSKYQKSLLYTRRDRLYINKTGVEEAGWLPQDLKCFFKYIHYLDSDNFQYGEETAVINNTKLSEKYNGVYAYCFTKRTAFMRYLIPTSLMSIFPLHIYRNVLIYVPDIKSQVRGGNEKYSIVTLVIDATSQLQLKRYMPETLSTLGELGGLEFSKHHKIGHNSFPNIMGLLSGMARAEFPDNANRESYAYIDDEFPPLLFGIFEKYGYTTMLMEDLQHLGDFNRDNRIGFKNPPTQIYYRAAFRAMGRAEISSLLNAQTGKSGSYGCLMEDLLLKFQLRALEDMMEMYRDRPFFAHLHLSEYTHDSLAYTHLYDKVVSQMLLNLKSSGALDNTFFLLLGDHGFQRGEHPFTRSQQGRIENNMPAFILLPPSRFKELRPIESANLAKNTNKLTSIFDINQMLRDILLIGDKSAQQDFSGLEGHGASLFNDLGDRGCQEAEINARFCTCTNKVIKLNETDKYILHLARAMLATKEATILDTGYCVPYELDRIKNVKLTHDETSTNIDMQLFLKTGAIFDAALSYNHEGSVTRFELTRMDWYSATSTCLPANLRFIQQFCICQSETS